MQAPLLKKTMTVLDVLIDQKSDMNLIDGWLSSFVCHATEVAWLILANGTMDRSFSHSPKILWKILSTTLLQIVDSVPEYYAGFEGKYPPGFDGDCLAGFGIAATPVCLLFYLETAKTWYLQFFSRLQGCFHDAEDWFQHIGGLPFGESSGDLDLFSKVGFGHYSLTKTCGISGLLWKQAGNSTILRMSVAIVILCSHQV